MKIRKGERRVPRRAATPVVPGDVSALTAMLSDAELPAQILIRARLRALARDGVQIARPPGRHAS